MIGSQGLALASATSFGISDFVGGVASRRVAALRVVLVSTPVSMVMLGGLALIGGGRITTGAIILGMLGGLSQALGIWWFYAAMAAGPISVVSPLAAVVDASVPVCVGRVLGERPGLLASAGIALALGAVVLISWHAGEEGVKRPGLNRRVIWLTVASGVALGLNFVFLDRTPSDAGLWPLLFARAAATVLVVVVAAASRNLRAPTGTPLRLAFLIALLDTAANVTMLFALQLSLLSLASVLISLYPAATVFLAVALLRERVRPRQVAGMVLAAAAVAMITG
ncbi:EamA family transporter [Mycolicibacter arupensis]|uniref:EamA family transporter n=1 Tax=Mycolicibacter arupensis TaxID=342002 RepID=A0A5B1MCS1_9MYCO|nr:EamA family transporter [Mycolicibacter arupensis]KAA1430743.1 EamA family transporter [Mycolicibacter arupensis]MCV7274512.1 EamA family transporter [Mycolicibacter arupensis]OQZ99333.1 EamA family transporter [Mycolicibacter arupensis]TXI59235.1 MAG: EamA family transporter [Mycolicibacter arupensis]